jgi:16S rRNA (cytidine1402-2'-O)-methyltransferase
VEVAFDVGVTWHAAVVRMTSRLKADNQTLGFVMSQDRSIGTLFVVATPIGNLDDITLRAVDVLKSVAIVAAEDTRRSGVLLAHIGARPERLLSLHDHNESGRSEQLLDLLQRGNDVALVSDAGTPLISDPGFELVRRVRREGVRVVPIPGPSALTAVLSASPLPIERFLFEGFLPSRSTARQKRLRELSASAVAVVFFEAARRLRRTLSDLIEIVEPEREILLAKELTKVHERIECGALGELPERLDGEFFERGEFVCVLAPADDAVMRDTDAAALMNVLCDELPPAQAARIAARITHRPRDEMYEYAVKLQRGE